MSEAISATRVDEMIAGIDVRLGGIVDSVLHHPDYQALEAAWRGLAHVVDHIAFDENVRVEVCNVTLGELQQDLSEAPEITRSWLFRTVYTAEYGQFGGKPYGSLYLNFAVSGSPDDVAMLHRLAAVAAMSHAPAFLAADPELLQLMTFADLPVATDLASAMTGPARLAWEALTAAEDSRYLGVLLPRMLLRSPYREADGYASRFLYEETIASASDLLWGSPTYAFAVRVAEVFATYRSYLGLIDGVGNPPPLIELHPALAGASPKPSVEVVLSPRVENQLSELGFIPLGYDLVTSRLVFRAVPSLQRPRAFGSSEGGEAATLNFLLGTRFPYIFLASRFAHYLKVIERERVGATMTRTETENELNDWLRQFVVALDGATSTTRLKYPLRAARVRLTDVEGEAGWYRMEVHLQPHLKYLKQAVVLSVAGRVESR